MGADRRSPEHPAVPGRILAVDAGEHRPAWTTQTRNPAAPDRTAQLSHAEYDDGGLDALRDLMIFT
jgi:hypothetical protein